jgi:hypothetical protein
VRVRLSNKSKPNNYTEPLAVNVADIWRERLNSYPGRSHGRVKTGYEIHSNNELKEVKRLQTQWEGLNFRDVSK